MVCRCAAFFFLFLFLFVFVRVLAAILALDHGVFGFFGAVAAADVGFDFRCRENEAIFGGVEGNSFFFIHFEEVGGFLQLFFFVVAAASLKLAELLAG